MRRWDRLAEAYAYAEEPAVQVVVTFMLEREVVAGGHSTGSVEVLTLTTCSPGVFCAALFLEHTDGLGILRVDSY
jgi:hypothetical protein